MRKFLIIFPLFFACSSSYDNGVSHLSHIAEFDSTDGGGGRYSELVVSRRITLDYDIDDFVSIGTAAGALRENCEILYKANKALKKSNGLRNEKTLNYLFCTMVKQYKMRRISNNEVERTRFFTKNLTVITRSTVLDTINNIANRSGERMDVPAYLKRRLRHNRHNIFGEVGSEEWFGGLFDNSFNTLSTFWDSVLVREPSSMTKRDAMQRNYSVNFLKKYRVLRMQDIPDSSASILTQPDTTSLKRKQALTLSASDSVLVAGRGDARNIKTFSFNSNTRTK